MSPGFHSVLLPKHKAPLKILGPPTFHFFKRKLHHFWQSEGHGKTKSKFSDALVNILDKTVTKAMTECLD